jgi:hypothetical protein
MSSLLGSKVIDEAPTSEINYGTSFGNYIERFNDHISKKQ